MWMRVCLIALAALCCHTALGEAPEVGRPAATMSDAQAQPVERVAGYWTLDYATGKITPGAVPLRGEIVYDNTTTDTGSGYAVFPDDPNHAVGDSLWMANDGLLDSLAFSVFNSDTSAGPLASIDVEIRFYDPFDTVLGLVTIDDLTFTPPLALGEVAFVTVENLAAEGINLPYACLFTILYGDAQGGSDSVGQAIYDPPTVGESPDMFYDGPTDLSGTHSWWFTGDPVANFYFQVVVEDPSPLEILWDTGPTHTVIFNGTETWLGYTSGEYPGCAQRWAAMPFVIAEPGAIITELQCFWWVIEGSEADHVNYIIWNRTDLNAPASFDDVYAQGELGTYEDGGRDTRAKPYGDWVPYHTYDVCIPIPAGDYYLTVYAEGTYPEDPDPNDNALAWESGANYVPEELEQEFFWRACNFPDPGFEAYTAGGAVSPGPEMTDPDDRWNLAYMLRGSTCVGDLDGDGTIGLADLQILLAHYGMMSGASYWDGDLNCDGQVSLADLQMLLAVYGTSC
jgi:hypothetical protein